MARQPSPFKIKYIRTPTSVTTILMLRYPGHDLWYKVREEIATGKKWYQPRCPCGWHSENWYPARGQRVERIVTGEHFSKTTRQGSLNTPHPSIFDGAPFSGIDPRLHDPSL